MIKNFDNFLNEKATINVESPGPMDLDFMIVPAVENISVVSVDGTFDDDTLYLDFELSDGNDIEFDGKFWIGPSESPSKTKDYVNVTGTSQEDKTRVTYDIDPEYYISLLENWSDGVFAILIHGIFYPSMKLKEFRNIPKLDMTKIKKR